MEQVAAARAFGESGQSMWWNTGVEEVWRTKTRARVGGVASAGDAGGCGPAVVDGDAGRARVAVVAARDCGKEAEAELGCGPAGRRWRPRCAAAGSGGRGGSDALLPAWEGGGAGCGLTVGKEAGRRAEPCHRDS
jgi:hypothetical protein